MQSPKHDTLNAAYMFYYASDAIFSPGGSSDDAERHGAKAKSKLDERLNALSNDMLVVAQNVSYPPPDGRVHKAEYSGWVRRGQCFDMPG